MVQLTNQDIFEKYNPKSEIKRCPNGLGSVSDSAQKLLSDDLSIISSL